MRQGGVVYDSRIRKKITEEDLRVSYKITDDELNFMTKLFQAYKINNLTTAPTIEIFMKELIFSNIEFFKEKCGYLKLYPAEQKEKK